MALLPHSPAFSPEEAPISPFTRLHSVPSNQSRDWTDNGCGLYTKANLTAQQLVIFNQRLENIVWKTESLQSFLAFVGYGRSSHTLLGALLDGHPRMVISNEYAALQYHEPWGYPWEDGDRWNEPFDRSVFFREIARNSVLCGLLGRVQTGFNYSFDGQLHWQGHVCSRDDSSPRPCTDEQRPLVIGDKKGGGTSRMLSEKAAKAGDAYELLFWFSRFQLNLPLRLLHVVCYARPALATMPLRPCFLAFALALTLGPSRMVDAQPL